MESLLVDYGIYFGIAAMIFGLVVMFYPIWGNEENRWVRMIVSAGGAMVTLVGFMLALGVYSAVEVREAPDAELEEIVGQPAPDFDFQLLGDDPQDQSLSDFEGQVLLINFWATWCAPCVHEMPDLSDLNEDYGDELTVLCISDETSDEVYGFLDDFQPLTQPIGVLHDVASIPDAYGMMQQIRPVSYVIDRDGVIREIIRGARSYRQFEERVVPYL